MTKEELAAELNGGEYRGEISKELEAAARQSGLVVVYGASDDLMEFAGAIHDELDACGGRIAYVTTKGMLENDCGNDECPYFEKQKKTAKTIEGCWDKEGYSWIFKTDIPHATFDILEDSEKYCRGIVFALADA